MNSKNISKYIVISILLIALFYKVLPYYYRFIHDSLQLHFPLVILEIILLLYLIFLIVKSKYLLNTIFKKIIKYSFLFTLSTAIIGGYWLFACQKGIFRVQTSAFFIHTLINSILFVFWSIILISKIKNTKHSFNDLFISLLSLLIISDIFMFSYNCIDTYLKSINYANPGSISMPGFLSFSISQFSMSNINLRVILTYIIESPLILSLFIIFYYSSYMLFAKYKKKGVYSLVPIKKDLIFLEISKKPAWWIIFLLIPFIRLVPKYFINVTLAKHYSKKSSFSFGMTLIPWLFYGKLILNDNNIANIVSKK